MKKLLLFTLSLGISALGMAQTPTNVSLNSFAAPTGTVYIDGSGSGAVVNDIIVNVTNNDAAVTFPDGSAFAYAVTLDGAGVTDPDALGWVRVNSLAIAPSQSENLTVTQLWSPNVSSGIHSVCVSLNNIVAVPNVYVNVSPNKTICKDFTFDFTASVKQLEVAEISKVTTSGDIMTIYVKNSSNQISINIMDLTGRIVKSVVPVVGGQDFYQNVNIGGLSSGVYIVAVQTENGISSAQKVFIQ